MIRRVCITVLLSLVTVSATAQQSGTPVFRVDLKISGDSDIASAIEGYLRQSLSSLKDVEISDSKPDYTINVIAMQLESKEKVRMGIAMTWLSLYHPKGFFEDCCLIEDYRLLTLQEEDIQSACQKFAARFDSKSLEPHRKLFQKPKP